MGEIFLFSLNAVMPVIALVVLGYFIKRVGLGNPDFFKTANSLVFRAFLPVMLFYNIYKIESLRDINIMLIVLFCAAILLIVLIGYFVARLVTKDRTKIPVIVQCSYRSNHALIGLSIAEIIGGEAAVSFASVVSLIAIPLYNVLAVLILSAFSNNKKNRRIKSTIIQSAKNPLILGCVAGIIAIAVRQFIPLDDSGELVFSIEKNIPFLMETVKSVSRMASPFALIVLGARMDFSAVRSLLKYITVGVMLRLIVSPIIGIGGIYLFAKYTGLVSVSAAEYPALIALFATPVAAASAVMVGEIGGDEQLATQYVVWTSVFSMFTIFLVIFAMKSYMLI